MGEVESGEQLARATEFLGRGDENVFKLTVVLVAQVCGSTENHQITHFRLVNCVPTKLVFLFERHKKCGPQEATLATPVHTTSPTLYLDCCFEPPSQVTTRPYGHFFSEANSSLSQGYPFCHLPQQPCRFLIENWARKAATGSNPARDSLGSSGHSFSSLCCSSVIE